MTKVEIGALITKKLEENNITQYEVVKNTKMFHMIIKSMKRGDSNYHIDSLIKFLDFLGLELEVKDKK